MGLISAKDKESLVQKLDDSLLNRAFGDIEKAAVNGTAKMSGFILGSCFIDALAGFQNGVTKESVKSGGRDRFIDFVETYLKKYDAVKLYEDLRCSLVHAYTEGGTYVFTHKNKEASHFQKTPKGKIVLNLEDFVGDLKKAYLKYKGDILSKDDIFLKAKTRYDSMGLLGVIDLKDA